MIKKEKDGISWLEFELFQQFPKVKHGIFLRHGGFSKGNYHSLNLSQSVGDDSNVVINNQTAVKNILNLSHLSSPIQVHGNQIQEVSIERSEFVCDGLITRLFDVGLMVTHADCQAAIFYDPIKHVVAVVHSGWKGSVANIYRETIIKMGNLYESKPHNIYVGISPSLGPSNAQFVNYKIELPEHLWKFQTNPNYFDFWEISRMQLLECGVENQHIEIAGICTIEHSKDYYSYRREKVTGRHGTVAGIVEQCSDSARQFNTKTRRYKDTKD